MLHVTCYVVEWHTALGSVAKTAMYSQNRQRARISTLIKLVCFYLLAFFN